MPVLAIDIGILNGVSCFAKMDFESAISYLQETKIEAKQLGLEEKVTEIEGLYEQVSQSRDRVIKSTSPELVWKSAREYLSSIQNIMRSGGESRELT